MVIKSSDFECFQVGKENIPEWFETDHLIKCTKEIDYKNESNIDFNYTFSPIPFDLANEKYILYNFRLAEGGEWIVRNRKTRYAMHFTPYDFEKFFGGFTNN